MRRVLIVLAILAIPNLTFAAWVDGNELYDLLSQKQKIPSNVAAESVGVGYVIGVIDSAENCIPQEVTRGQLTDISFRYLDTHPEYRHFAASFLVRAAITEKFPCPKGKK
jgi:hypothetical protein